MRYAISFCVLALMTSAALADDAPDYRYDDVGRRIADLDTQITTLARDTRDEIYQSYREDLKGDEGRKDRLDKALKGFISKESIDQVHDVLQGGPAGDRELAESMQRQLDGICRPLTAVETELRGKQRAYAEKLKEHTEVSIAGAPYGSGGDMMRQMKREIEALIEKRDRLKARTDQQIRDHNDLPYQGVDDMQQAIDWTRNGYIEKTLAGHRIVLRMLSRLTRLVDERDRLREIDKYGEMFIVWYNDVGWLYVGTRKQFAHHQTFSFRDVHWGGESDKKMNSYQVLDKAGYATQALAIEAVGKAITKAEYVRSPLTDPDHYHRGTIGGRVVMLQFDIVGHQAFKPYLPGPPE